MSWGSNPSPGFKWRPRLGFWTDGVNNTFDHDIIEAKSYNWWTYVSKIKGKVVFNNYNYSQTTSHHQGNAKDLLKKLGIKIDVTVYMRQSLSSFQNEALPGLYEEMFTIEIESKTARKDGLYVKSLGKWYSKRSLAVEHIKKMISECRKLGAIMSRDKIKELKNEVLASNAARLEKARNIRKAARPALIALQKEMNDLSSVSLEIYKEINDLNEIKLKKGA